MGRTHFHKNYTFLNFNWWSKVSSRLLFIRVFLRVIICIWAADDCVFTWRILYAVECIILSLFVKGERNDHAVDDNDDITLTTGYSSFWLFFFSFVQVSAKQQPPVNIQTCFQRPPQFEEVVSIPLTSLMTLSCNSCGHFIFLQFTLFSSLHMFLWWAYQVKGRMCREHSIIGFISFIYQHLPGSLCMSPKDQ